MTSSSHRSASTAARTLRSGHHERNGGPASVPEPSPGEYDGPPRAVPDLPHESLDDRGWDERVAREVSHQQLIEASFDRAEAYERLGDPERALKWLDRAAALSGGLPPAYRALHARCAGRPRVDSGRQAAIGSMASPDREKRRADDGRDRDGLRAFAPVAGPPG